MKCGKGHDHPDRQAVRDCYADRNGGTYFQAAPAAFQATLTRELPPPPTDFSPDADAYWDRQMQLREAEEDRRVALYKSRRDAYLAGELRVTDEEAASYGHVSRHPSPAPTVERDRTGRNPRPAPRENLRALFSAITPGYYATLNPTGSNDLDFWWVQRPDKGTWAGMTFVKRILGGHPPIRIPKGQQIKVLKELAALTPQAREVSQKVFAEQLGRCYRCGRTLTDETSRALGIGPDCRSK